MSYATNGQASRAHRRFADAPPDQRGTPNNEEQHEDGTKVRLHGISFTVVPEHVSVSAACMAPWQVVCHRLKAARTCHLPPAMRCPRGKVNIRIIVVFRFSQSSAQRAELLLIKHSRHAVGTGLRTGRLTSASCHSSCVSAVKCRDLPTNPGTCGLPVGMPAYRQSRVMQSDSACSDSSWCLHLTL